MILKGKSYLTLVISAAIIPLAVLFAGCENEGGSGALEALFDEPMILESVMCLAVEDGRPESITSKFLTTDEDIYIWLYWVNIEGRSTIETRWFEPDNDTAFHTESQTIDSSTDSAITWFYIKKPADGFAEGEWCVEIYLNDQFERSLLFDVIK